MADDDVSGPDLMSSLRRLGRSLLGLARARVELFAVELQEEKLRAMTLGLWLCVAITLGVAGLLVGIGALALFLWQVAGYAGLVGLAVVLLVGAAGLGWGLRRQILRGPGPFAGTIAEFGRDVESLNRSE